MLFSLLASATSAASSAKDSVGGTKDYTYYIFIFVMIALIVVYFIFSSRQRKKQREEYEKKMDGIVVGDKVTTIGMWVGEVVEILPDGNYVLKTGTDEHVGYVTVNKQGIYTIAKPNEMSEGQEELPTEPPTEDAPVFEDMAQTSTEQSTEETTEATTEETVENQAEETTQETVDDEFATQHKATINGEPQE